MQLQTPVRVRPAQPLLNCAGAPSQETIMAARSAAGFLAAGVIKRATITVRSSAAGHDSLNLSVASMILSGVPLRLLSDAVQQLTAHRLRELGPLQAQDVSHALCKRYRSIQGLPEFSSLSELRTSGQPQNRTRGF
jgi:hypothetical protein